ncbi:hypothetical protein [Streptomyces niveus]|uniref:Right handed beta helix domain-containing protein n=1 Tax=Streptomyces niveus TaxID=193462 RepID=A0A1U9QYQ5_STRNV|nr:hypothetical protein [Streptomyces niveus]AQU69340.1 hypothetical protein BBN63_27310 [Streptomyces niveus]
MRFPPPKAAGVLTAVGLALGLAAIPAPAYAAPITCDAKALVTAIDAANLAGGGTVELAANCVYSLDAVEPAAGGNGPNGLPVITEAVTVNGANSVIERATAAGTPKFRFFEIGGARGELTLNRVTLRNGDPTVLGTENGGAILVNANRVLTVNNSVLTGNTAHEGGAIASLGGSSTRISGSEFTSNSAVAGGGGLFNLGGGIAILSTTMSETSTTVSETPVAETPTTVSETPVAETPTTVSETPVAETPTTVPEAPTTVSNNTTTASNNSTTVSNNTTTVSNGKADCTCTGTIRGPGAQAL